jgi:uncharacterized membrane protein YidH (DUF202 family)
MKKTKMEIYQEEQLVLSKERTILSFMRTGVAFLAAGVVVISILEQFLADLTGYGLIIFGAFEIFESFRRLKSKQEEMHKLKKELEKARRVF